MPGSCRSSSLSAGFTETFATLCTLSWRLPRERDREREREFSVGSLRGTRAKEKQAAQVRAGNATRQTDKNAGARSRLRDAVYGSSYRFGCHTGPSRDSMNKNDMLTSMVQPAETNSGNAGARNAKRRPSRGSSRVPAPDGAALETSRRTEGNLEGNRVEEKTGGQEGGGGTKRRRDGTKADGETEKRPRRLKQERVVSFESPMRLIFERSFAWKRIHCCFHPLARKKHQRDTLHARTNSLSFLRGADTHVQHTYSAMEIGDVSALRDVSSCTYVRYIVCVFDNKSGLLHCRRNHQGE